MPESAKKSVVILIYLGLLLSTLLVFWQVRNFSFVNYDDNAYVYENHHVLNGLTGDGIIWAFTTCHFGYWQPLTWLSLMLDCQLFGPNPGWMHFENVLLHLANTLLLFAILKRMTGSIWPSAFVAAGFALHPMHVESVAWIAERKDVLSTLFWMLTLLAYIRYVRQPTVLRYVVTFALFAVGLLAKPMLITLPFIFLLLDYWPLNRFEALQPVKISGRQSCKLPFTVDRYTVLSSLIIEKLPFFFVSAVSSLVTFMTQQAGGIIFDIKMIPLKARIGNVFLSYAGYIGKMFWPGNLVVFYPFDVGNFEFWQIVLCSLLLVAVSFFVIYARQKQQYLLVGWFWFVGTLLPVIGLVQFTASSYADRYTYIAYIGLFIMITWGMLEFFSKWPYRKIVFGVFMAAVLVAMAMCAYRQASYWKNSSTLFSHAIAVTQNNYVAYNCLARDLQEHGKNALAVEAFKKSLEINPEYVNSLIGLGGALSEQGDTQQAIEFLQKALQLEPTRAEVAYAYDGLGIALRKQGNFTEAAAYCDQAIQIMPDFAEARYDLAVIFFQQGRLDEAIDKFREAVKLKPDWLEPMNNIASLMATHPELKDRDVNEAVSLARHTCELTDYKNPLFLGTLAAAYASAGKFSEAIETAKAASVFANAANLPEINNIIQYQLTLYTQGKPYIEPPAKPLTNPNKP